MLALGEARTAPHTLACKSVTLASWPCHSRAHGRPRCSSCPRVGELFLVYSRAWLALIGFDIVIMVVYSNRGRGFFAGCGTRLWRFCRYNRRRNWRRNRRFLQGAQRPLPERRAPPALDKFHQLLPLLFVGELRPAILRNGQRQQQRQQPNAQKNGLLADS